MFVSRDQVNAQLPAELPESGRQALQVMVGDQTTAAQSVTLQPAAPGVFTVHQSGQGQGVIVDTNFQLVDANRPARAGDVVAIFCTGLGVTDPPVPSGQAGNGQRVAAQVTVTIGGREARVSFAGLAPGFVGLYQVNVEVPAGLPAGNHEVLVSAAEHRCRGGVTVAVR